ncbi:Imm51 family immunity protein [Nocardiopsis sp. RSe5-2]|uniref:Imm51 family immunity protein n=1 Tax=Nocardiopsis endophytica TaxID=3018445 RepID=A0ABT4UAU7_9ACTN|nr:Imm51 family immunity protein [Nocardiopsis endophytica]MDA2813515.1 Imm51 family immunity protein [Nocardiopsis endophytica]
MPDQHRMRDGRVPECGIDPFSLFLFHADPDPRYVLELGQDAVGAVKGVFVAQGQAGGAGDWNVVAALAAQAEAPDIADLLNSVRLEFESGQFHQADGTRDDYFAVTADEADVGALRRLGMVLAGLYRDSERLGGLIREADPDLFELS